MLIAREHTESTLNSFRKYVVKQARTNLTKQGHNDTKALYDSLRGESKVSANSFELGFYMENYGQFQDKGVKGKFSSSRAPNSPFQFGSGTGKKGGLTDGIFNWVKHKQFQFKDRKTGKFLSYKSTAFLITRAIYNKGIRPTKFFSRPFDLAFNRLPDDIIEAYGLDVETFLKFTLKTK